MTYEKLIQEMDEKLQFPGLTNTWTMPVENRLDMELTGIKTAARYQDPRTRSRPHPGHRRADAADPLRHARNELRLCRARLARVLPQRRSEPAGSGALWIDRRRCAARRSPPESAEQALPRMSKAANAIPSPSAMSAISATTPRRWPSSDRDSIGRADPHQPGRARIVFARTRHDPR